MGTTTKTLYDTDFVEWADQTAALVRAGRFHEVDVENLAEEIEDLGKAERHRLESHFESLLMHLLKWKYQPRPRTRSWSNSVREHRFRIQRVLRDNPSLKASLPQVLVDAYEAARFSAENETGLDVIALPESCPWSLDDAMHSGFGPGVPVKQKERGRSKRASTNS